MGGGYQKVRYVCSEVASKCPSLISLLRHRLRKVFLCDHIMEISNKGLRCQLLRIFSIVPAITILTYKAWPDTQDTISTIVKLKRYLNAIFAVLYIGTYLHLKIPL